MLFRLKSFVSISLSWLQVIGTSTTRTAIEITTNNEVFSLHQSFSWRTIGCSIPSFRKCFRLARVVHRYWRRQGHPWALRKRFPLIQGNGSSSIWTPVDNVRLDKMNTWNFYCKMPVIARMYRGQINGKASSKFFDRKRWFAFGRRWRIGKQLSIWITIHLREGFDITIRADWWSELISRSNSVLIERTSDRTSNQYWYVYANALRWTPLPV